jgi:Periplasmic binding protein
VLAACSSSSSHSSTATTASSGQTTQSTGQTATQATGSPIKVGVICSCSGPLGNNDLPKEDVYRSWVNTVNLAGGISGHPIQLTLKDDSSNPGTSLSDVQTLIADHLDAILDITNYDEPWASAVQAANIPVIGGNVFDVPFYTNPDFFPEGQTTDSSTYSAVATAKAAGANNVGEFYCAEAARAHKRPKTSSPPGRSSEFPWCTRPRSPPRRPTTRPSAWPPNSKKLRPCSWPTSRWWFRGLDRIVVAKATSPSMSPRAPAIPISSPQHLG